VLLPFLLLVLASCLLSGGYIAVSRVHSDRGNMEALFEIAFLRLAFLRSRS
jgi:hypothetical protein